MSAQQIFCALCLRYISPGDQRREPLGRDDAFVNVCSVCCNPRSKPVKMSSVDARTPSVTRPAKERAKMLRDQRRRDRLCVNSAKHGPATHGVRCEACQLVYLRKASNRPGALALISLGRGLGPGRIAAAVAAVLLTGCLRPNPDFCCETLAECAELAPRPCEVGVCVHNACVDIGCDGPEDCADGTSCTRGTCYPTLLRDVGIQVDGSTPCEIVGVCPAGWPCTANRQCASDSCQGLPGPAVCL